MADDFIDFLEDTRERIFSRTTALALILAGAILLEIFGGHLTNLYDASSVRMRLVGLVVIVVAGITELGVADWILDKLAEKEPAVYLLSLGNKDKEIEVIEFGLLEWARQTFYKDYEPEFFMSSNNVPVYIARDYDWDRRMIFPNWRKVANPAEIERRKNAILATQRILENELDKARDIVRLLPALRYILQSRADDRAMEKVDIQHKDPDDKPIREILAEEIEHYQEELDQEDQVEYTKDEYDSDEVEDDLGDQISEAFGDEISADGLKGDD
ncbi:hypothetical protein G3I44_13585 [Halogeometricum borinquense]|uniref:Uncharacterized protein n=1 Tax=Halogeometricum borinquense TaxID=60847 RepID=A0A6C0UIG9_9EURY|nr:hypothetical protein [Halogeometricum borinquense]QIB75225.1 hypothetical protein G3I44_13585 [Halogeometricum borinquense]